MQLNFKELLIGHAESDSNAAQTGSLILRVTAGLALAYAHGWRKVPPSEGFVNRVDGMGFPLPEFFAWMAGMAEFTGGLLLAIGLLTRPAALFVTLNMLVVVFIAHAGDTFRDRELGLLFLVIAFYYTLAGSGKFSLDEWIRRRLNGDKPDEHRKVKTAGIRETGTLKNR